MQNDIYKKIFTRNKFCLFQLFILFFLLNSCYFKNIDPLTFNYIYKHNSFLYNIEPDVITNNKSGNKTNEHRKHIQNSAIESHTSNKSNSFKFNTEIYPMNFDTFNMYRNLIKSYIKNGWETIWCFIQNGQFTSYSVVTDKLWAQGFYGIYLALDYKNTKFKETRILMYNFVDSIYKLLKKTNGIFLRDNTDKALEKYLEKNISSLEASKDQMIGLITALFMIYYYSDPYDDMILRKKIKYLFKYLNNIFNKHYYILYNNNEKRLYNSAWYLQLHYYGFKYAFDYILGVNRPTNPEVEKLNIQLCNFTKFKILILRKSIITKKLRILGFINPWKTPILKKLQLFSPSEFNINLKFFEYIIVSTVSKKEAIKILKTLENIEIRRLKHLNLAALYFYIINKWGLNGNYIDYYKKVLTRDITYYPLNIPPNSLKIGSFFKNKESDYLFDPVNHQCVDRTFSLDFNKNWNIKPPVTDKTLQYLINESYKYRIKIYNGLFLLTRYYLYSFNKLHPK